MCAFIWKQDVICNNQIELFSMSFILLSEDQHRVKCYNIQTGKIMTELNPSNRIALSLENPDV